MHQSAVKRKPRPDRYERHLWPEKFTRRRAASLIKKETQQFTAERAEIAEKENFK